MRGSNKETAMEITGSKSPTIAPNMDTTTPIVMPTAKTNINHQDNTVHGLMELIMKIIKEAATETVISISNGLTHTPKSTPIMSSDGRGGM